MSGKRVAHPPAGSTDCRMEPCKHPTVMWDLCAECGMDLRKLDKPNQHAASVSMVHSVPELRVSMEQAQKLGKVDEERLLDKRKLVLLVDLDQTLIHTTNDNVPNNLKDVFHFQLWGHGSVWYHTRIRPHTLKFLENISKLYELHICTFGTRNYAYTIAHQLDPMKKLFSDRILSRDECFSQNSKTANLKELFPRGDHMVCIIDDREDVWNYAPNLIHVKPYHFFRHTGDINAPPGLDKQDQDDKSGFQFDGDKVDALAPKPEHSNEAADATKSEVDSASDSNSSSETEKEKAVGRVVSDLNLSEDDESENNDSGKDEAARDADMEESNEEDNQQEEEKQEKENAKPESNPVVEENKSEASGESKAESTPAPAAEENKSEASGESKTESTPAPTAEESKSKASGENNSEASVENKSEEASGENNSEASVENKSEEASGDNKSEGSGENKSEASGENKTDTSSAPENETPSEKSSSKTANEKPEHTTVSNSNSNSTTDEPDSKGKPGDNKASKVIEVEDEDDYLLYLEQILQSIHDAFYALHDDMTKRKESGVPDVKNVIPYVRRKVLKSKSICIVFSGVVPTHVPLTSSKAYQIAVNLGAHVSEKIIPPNKPGSSSNSDLPTTHVVAARMGTAKVNEARRYKGIHIVTPEWLWTCAERWEHVEEKLYRLEKAKNVKRNPPPHCSSPSPDFRREKFEVVTPIDGPDDEMPSTSKGSQPAMRKERTPSGRFMDTINPLLSFSAREIETMAHEVDDIFNESESSSSDDEEERQKEQERAARRRSSRSSSGQDRDKTEDPSTSEVTNKSLSSSTTSSDSSDDDDDDDFESRNDPFNRKRKRDNKTETETEDEPLSVKFRRGEPLPSDIDSLNLMNPSSEDDDDEQEANEEDEWMAQALEREFLDGNSRSQDSFDMR